VDADLVPTCTPEDAPAVGATLGRYRLESRVTL